MMVMKKKGTTLKEGEEESRLRSLKSILKLKFFNYVLLKYFRIITNSV